VVAVGLFILLRERTFADALAIRLAEEPDMEVLALETRALPPRSFVTRGVDVVLLDADMADDAAFRMCQELSQNGKAPHVIFLSHSADPGRIIRGIGAGAVGWVCQYESLDRLLHVIRGVARDEMWLPPGETAAVLRLLMRGPDPDRNGCRWPRPKWSPHLSRSAGRRTDGVATRRPFFSLRPLQAGGTGPGDAGQSLARAR